MGPGSTAANPHAKPYAHAAGLRAVQDHCDRTGIDADVRMLSYQGYHRLHRRVAGHPTVSVVIPTSGSRGQVWGRTRCFVLDTLADLARRSTYDVHEVILVVDTTTSQALLDDACATIGDRLSVVAMDGPFSFAGKVNLGAAHASGDLLLLLNDDVQIIDEDFLATMVGLSQAGDVGAVGCRLLYADGTLQHAGHVYNGHAYHAFIGRGADEPGPNGLLLVEREVSGVTAACMLVKAAVFDAVGGLSPAFPMNFNDVDLCLKVRQLGLRILYTPHASLYHFESGTRRNEVAGSEEDVLRARWADQLDHDPYHHPDLLRGRDDWAVPYGAA